MNVRYLLSGLLTPLFLLGTFCPSVQAQDATPASQIAEHAVCRGLLAADRSAQVVCFLAFVDGVSGSLFSANPSEASAYLTLRTDTITVQPIVNAGLVALLQSVGTYSIYLNNSPHGIHFPADNSSRRSLARRPFWSASGPWPAASSPPS